MRAGVRRISDFGDGRWEMGFVCGGVIQKLEQSSVAEINYGSGWYVLVGFGVGWRATVLRRVVRWCGFLD